MTNEQREAIDTLKEITENDLLNYWEGTERPYNAIQIVLSLIKEQQIYIKKSHDTTEEMNRDIRKLISEIQKKDKQIDLMAEYIATLDIEEDVCANIENDNCDKMALEECEDCIKQYFARKVEDVKG